MKKILIANRGEIANRIIKSCKILGHKSVAVYSDADKNSKHVRLSDESYHIGPSKAQESYLSYNKILEIATKSNVDAIHPGFGFLSENDTFAQEVIDRGITWIGPKPKSIKSMGNKDIARELALNSNIPICPGINNVHKLSDEQLKTKCEAIGYPLLVKSSAGGGGIGMSVVQNFKDLANAIEKTSNLAAKSFGNGDIFIEKFITNARHIEIQVFGFGAKGSVHLFERDCSMQRRYQKIIEESPAPEVDRELINNMAQAAVKLSSDVKYEGAGTVEFIYDVQEMKYYFLEMNTRIQVEHPVTELVTNNDLISMQINFAFNRKNKFLNQNKIKTYGHSIECRVNAENAKNFKVHPVEPAGFDDVARSLISGKRETNDNNSSSLCDAIVTPSPGILTFPILKDFCYPGMVVTESEVLKAMRIAFERLKIVIEPGGAVALAAALYHSELLDIF